MPNIRLMEIDGRGHIVWRYALKTFARDALRLRNGNTLIMYATQQGRDRIRIIEIDTAGRVRWEAFSPDSDHCVRPCLSLCSLGFDNIFPAHRDLSQDLDYLLGRLTHQDVRVRERAAYALADLGPRASPAARPLIEVLRDPDEFLCRAACIALSAIGPEAIPEVLNASKDRLPHVRMLAVSTLGQFTAKPNIVVPGLLEAVHDQDVTVRRSAIRALQGHLSLRKTAPQPIPLTDAELQRILPLLVHALSDPDSATSPNEATVSQLSAMLLEKLGPMARSAVPAIVGALRSKDYLLRGYAIAALASLETESKVAVPLLLDVLRFNDVNDPEHRKYLRNCVIAALGQVAGPEAEPAMPVLVSTLKDQNLYRTYRVSAAKALGKIGPKAASSAIPALTDLLHCDDKQLRSEAEKALRDIRR